MDTNKSNMKKDPRVDAQTPQDMKWIKQERVDDFLSLFIFWNTTPKKTAWKKKLKEKKCIS